MKEIFLMVDPKSHIRNQIDVLNRHKKYAKELFSKSEQNVILSVISFGLRGKIESKKVEDIWLINFPVNPLLFLRNVSVLKKMIIDVGRVKLLISGDPWIGATVAILTSRFLTKNSSIEIQIHADIGDLIWKSINFKNRLKYIYAGFTLGKADQIRCVSRMQADKIAKRFPSLQKKMVIIPVVSSTEHSMSRQKLNNERPISIGFVGRIQQDRGTDKFIETVRKLNTIRQDFLIIIAGSGKKSDVFLAELREIVGMKRVVNFGEIESEQIANVWNQIGVLLSCPPAESYGRTLREAISYGVPIWITRTSGGEEFSKMLKPEYFQFLENVTESRDLEFQFSLLSKAKIDSKDVTQIIEKEKLLVGKLIDSWLKFSN